MKLFKKVSLFLVFLLITSILQQINPIKFNNVSSIDIDPPIRASVLISNFNIYLTSLIIDNMKKVEQENPETIHYTFFDCKGSQDIQNRQVNSILRSKEADILIIDMVDISSTKYVIDRIKENNIPVMFFGNGDLTPVMSYSKSCLVIMNPSEGGVLQGQILVDAWNKNKSYIDKNNDNILQYVMLEGSLNNMYAVARSKYSLQTINENNIKTEDISTKICDWKEEEAMNTVNSLLLKYGNKIEAIISNDDTMAIGAITALQKNGYNINRQNVLVVGFDGRNEAQDLIQKGVMTGTVLVNPYDLAKDVYFIGMNLIYNRNLLENTNCTIDYTQKLLTIPYGGVVVNFN